jgi:hypothetical protein
MLPDELEVQNMKLQVGLLERDIKQTNYLCEKMSESIEKLQEVSISLNRMITLHEQRHLQHEKAELSLTQDTKDLHSRITTVNREIHDRIDQVEKHITERIDNLRSDLIQHKKEEVTHNISDIIKEIERYKWIILGAVLVLGWLIGNINLGILFK